MRSGLVAFVLSCVGLEAASRNEGGTASRRTIFYTHIPKTGAPMLKKAIELCQVKYMSQSLFPAGKKLDLCTPEHQPPGSFPAPNPYARTSVEIITLLRHPFDRLISQHRFSCWGSHEKLGLKPPKWRTLSRAEAMNFILDCKENVTLFRTFLTADIHTSSGVVHRLANLSRCGLCSHSDCQYLPQTEYLRVVPATPLNSKPRGFCDMKDFGRFLAESSPSKKCREATAQLREQERYNWSRWIDEETRSVLVDAYRDDFALCNYTTEIPRPR